VTGEGVLGVGLGLHHPEVLQPEASLVPALNLDPELAEICTVSGGKSVIWNFSNYRSFFLIQSFHYNLT